MTVKTEHYKVGGSVRDGMKMPSVFWVGLKAMGLPPAVVLRHSNIPLTVCSGESLMTTGQIFTLWRTIRELGKDPTLGWKGMRNFRSDQFHPSLLAALNARSYRESLERLARYKQLCGAQEFRFTEEGGELAIEVNWPFAPDQPPPPLFLDAVFALVMELGRRGTQTNLSPKRIELARREEPGSGLNDYFACPIKYQSRRNVLILRVADVDLPFVAHNEELLQILAPHLENQLKAGQTKPSIREMVAMIVKRLLAGCRPDMATIARELGMSERSLQRRITEEGTTFRQLLNEIRRELVQEYLADESVEIADAAFLLGYGDMNSFYRAFRSWEGQTPAEWRVANQGRSSLRNHPPIGAEKSI